MLQLARFRYGEPVAITGDDRFKGAVLSRAIDLNISIANPELAPLQALLTQQRYPQRASTNGTTAPTARSTMQTDVRNTATATDPSSAAINTPEALRTQVEERMRALYPDGSIGEHPLPEEHRPSETRLYRVIKANDNALAIDHNNDGNYSIIGRTTATEHVNDGDWVRVSTGPNGAIALVEAHRVSPTAEVPRAATIDTDQLLAKAKDAHETRVRGELEAVAKHLRDLHGRTTSTGHLDALKSHLAENGGSRSLRVSANNDAGIVLHDPVTNTAFIVGHGTLTNSQSLTIEEMAVISANADGTLTARLASAPTIIKNTSAAATPSKDAGPATTFSAVPPLNDLTRSLLHGNLDGEAREKLAAMGKAADKITYEPFVWPEGNCARTILAKNDLGFAVQIPAGRGAKFTIVMRDQVPVPDAYDALHVGEKMSFGTSNGVKQILTPKPAVAASSGAAGTTHKRSLRPE